MNVNGRRRKIINKARRGLDSLLYSVVTNISLDIGNSVLQLYANARFIDTYLSSLSISQLDGNYNGIRIFLCA